MPHQYFENDDAGRLDPRNIVKSLLTMISRRQVIHYCSTSIMNHTTNLFEMTLFRHHLDPDMLNLLASHTLYAWHAVAD